MNIEELLRSAADNVPPAVTLDEVRARAQRTTEPTAPIPIIDVGRDSGPHVVDDDAAASPGVDEWGARAQGSSPVRAHRRLAVAAVGLVVAGLTAWSPWADDTGDDSVVAGKPDDETPELIVSGEHPDDATDDADEPDADPTEDVTTGPDESTTTIDDGGTTSGPTTTVDDGDGSSTGEGPTGPDRSTTTTSAPSTPTTPTPATPTTTPTTTSTTATPTTVPFDATIPPVDRTPVAESWAGQPVGQWTEGGSLPGSVEAYDECGINEQPVTIDVLEHLSDGLWAIAATTDPSIVGPERSGYGVWRSRDAGASWSTVPGLSFSSPFDVVVCNGTPTEGVPALDGHPRAIAELGGRVVIGGDVDASTRTPTVWTSTPDGSGWRAIPLPAPSNGYAVVGLAATSDGIVALGNTVGSSGAPVVWRSSDGYTWALSDTGAMLRTDNVVDITAHGGRIVAVGSTYPPSRPERPAAWASVNGGRSWSRVTVPARDPGDGATTVTAVAAGPSGFVAVGYADDIDGSFLFDGLAWTSPDGLSWSLRGGFGETGRIELARAVASTPSGFVVVGYSGASWTDGSAMAWTSPNGASWTAIPAGPHSAYHLAAAGNGVVAIPTQSTCGGVVSCGTPPEPMVARRVRTG